MKQYNIVKTFEIDGQTYEAGSVAELSDELVSRISSSFISAVEGEAEVEVADTSADEANGDEASDVAADDAAADAGEEGADEDAE